jgi:transposase-like protein
MSALNSVVKFVNLNNLIEQNHRFIKKITSLMMGFKAFHSDKNIAAYKQFMALAD